MSTESVPGGPISASNASRSGSNVLLTVLFFILALAVMGGAVYYVGGVDYVTSLLNSGSGAPSGDSSPAGAPAAVPATATAAAVSTTELQLPPGVTPDLAKRMYVEEIQSQENLIEMAAGNIARFDVTKVTQSADKTAAAIFVTAFYTDGTSAPGVIQVVKPAGAWYLMSFTGTDKVQNNGYGDVTNHGLIATGLQANEKVIAESGITTFDYGVINTLLASQTADQAIIVRIIDGTLNKIGLGAPIKGAGTTTVPANLTGSAPQPVAGEALLIHKTVAGEDLTFLTSFRAN